MKYIFEWDSGNMLKSVSKHNVSNQEAEDSFGDKKALTLADEKHSGEEERFLIYGKNKEGKVIVNCFTIRDGKIRIISSRRANRKEIKLYESNQ